MMGRGAHPLLDNNVTDSCLTVLYCSPWTIESFDHLTTYPFRDGRSKMMAKGRGGGAFIIYEVEGSRYWGTAMTEVGTWQHQRTKAEQ